MTPRKHLAFACFLAAAVWPWLIGALAGLLMSPLERASQSAWCGMPQHVAVFLGHCTACWAGSAIIAATGALLLWSASAPQSPAHQAAPSRNRKAVWSQF